MERARVNGVDLEYEVRGKGEPVLLIHGSHVARSFFPLMSEPALVDSYMLIRYHRRGWLGSTSPQAPFSIEEQAADARALLEYLGVRQSVHVVGHSYGGPIAMQLAHDHPECVHSLALMEAALVYLVPRGKSTSELIRLASRLYRQGDWEAAEDWFLGSPKERADIMRNVPGGLEQALADMDTFFEVEVPAHEQWRFGADEGARIRQPVLSMLGGESSPLYVECNNAVREWMPQTETVVLPGASHLLHIQEPEGAAVLLRNFFARHPLPAAVQAASAARRTRARPTDRYNAASDLLDGNLERGRSDKVAIRTYGVSWTYADVARQANRVGNALRGLGVEVEQRVLLALPDSFEFAATFFGAIKLGAVPVPVGTNLRPEEYAGLLVDSRAKTAVVDESVAAALLGFRRELADLRHVVVVGRPEPGELGFDELTRAADDTFSPADTSRDDACFWLYTSGTTGRPKGVVHLQHDMRFCADTYGKHVLELSESDVTFSVPRLYFGSGLGGGLYYPFSAGATTVLLPQPPQPRVVFNAIQEFRPTILFGVPTSYQALLVAVAPSAWPEADLSSIRLCVSAGEVLGGQLLKRWKETTGLDILDGIGSTEACTTFISNRKDDVRADCTGTLVEGWQAKVVNDDGVELPDGEPGLLMVKGDAICAGYWRRHDLTRQALFGEWLSTGDTFVRDETGHFYYQGRTDEMLKVGGLWVSPREIEAVLDEHEAVAESAVIGVRDADGLTRPEAFVVPVRSGGEQQLEGILRSHVRKYLGGNKTPRAFYFVNALPESATQGAQRSKAEVVTLVGMPGDGEYAVPEPARR